MKKSIVNGENRGSINEILLKALQTGDKYGYEINKEIEVKSKGKYFIKEASLYSGLKRLESAGYITSYWKDGNLGIRRHYYSISEKGLEKLNNSNFSWDDSKEELMLDLFKSSNQTAPSKQIEMDIKDNTTIKENSNEEKLVQKSTNPFAYIVSENQQDMFSSFNLFEKKEENNTTNLEHNIETKEEDIKTENSVDFEEAKKEIKFKNSYLNSKTNKNNLNIFDYINELEQNSSIVYSQSKEEEKVEPEKKEDVATNLFNEETLISRTDNYSDKENSNDIFSNSQENSNKDKLKDIFKNLLVDETEQNFVKDEMAVEQPKEIEESYEIKKTELPRIKLENDVNVTLQTGKNSSYSKPYFSAYTPQQNLKNTPSVRQYLTKARSLNLSNKNLEEDISLHGFKIRRYAKMNSRSYKTSNYYYPNILNLVLISILGGICLLESILGLIYANSSTFSIVLFVIGIALSLALIGFEMIKFEKDKYKVEIKNYNFKTSLFYFVMIFIVLTIILVCVNILRGMNLNNFGNFTTLLVFETLISFNLVLYPIVKLLLLKSGKFNN